MSRIGRRVLLTGGLIGMIAISCGWYAERPTVSLAWVLISCVVVLLWIVVDRRYQKPYRYYAVSTAIITWGSVLWFGQLGDISLSVIVLYAVVLVTILLSWMLWPVRRWTIPLLILIAMGLLMMVPWVPQFFSPTTITDRLPLLQIYWSRQVDDESLSVITTEGTRAMRSDQWTSIGADQLMIEYAAIQSHENYVVIQFNTLTTLALSPQSVLLLEYDEYSRSGALEGQGARYTRENQGQPMTLTIEGQSYVLTGQGSIGIEREQSLEQSLEQSYNSLLLQAQEIADSFRPSSWTSTMLGASFVRLKLWGLSQIDVGYQQDLTQLYQYQCLVYEQRCALIAPERQRYSLGISTRDADLQATTFSGSVEARGWWERVKVLVGY